MQEIFGDLFAYYNRPGYKICLTTNGFIKKDGTGVMGRGCAREAVEFEPDLPRLLGVSLKARGNVVANLTAKFIAFPVKHTWEQDADLTLIKKSAIELKLRALTLPDIQFILPRPGCGNGKLLWENVKPILEEVEFPSNIIIIGKWEERPNAGANSQTRS